MIQQEEQDIRRKFKNNDSGKITESLMAGLIRLYKQETSRFSKNDINEFEQEVNSKGQLTAILIHMKTEKAEWFKRVVNSVMSMHALTFPDRERKSGENTTLFLNPDAVKKLPYQSVLNKFGNGFPDKANHFQLHSLQEIASIVDNISGKTSYSLEQRLQYYDPSTKKSSGDLQTVMLKLHISPSSSIKNMNEFNDTFIPKLHDALGADFDRLVKEYGQAIDGSAYINLWANELEQGLKSSPGLQM